MDAMFEESSEWLANFQDVLMSYGVTLVIAVLIFIVGLVAAKTIARIINKVLIARHVDVTVANFLSSLVRYALLAFVIIAALGQLGVQTASFVAIVGAAGLAVGLALQGSLSNFASGVLLILFRPFKAGDYVEIAGAAGSVESIQIFSTILKTPDNKVVIVSNSAVWGGNIVNYSQMPTRRVDLVVSVSYDADLKQTREVLKSVVTADTRVLLDEELRISVSELADSSVNFVVRPWVKSADYWDVYFDLKENIKNALDQAGIEIPYPQVVMHQPA